MSLFDGASGACCCLQDVVGTGDLCSDPGCFRDSIGFSAGFYQCSKTIIGGAGTFVDERVTVSISGQLVRVGGVSQFRLEGQLSGSYELRREFWTTPGACGDSWYCPSCGSCCGAIRLAYGYTIAGNIKGLGIAGCSVNPLTGIPESFVGADAEVDGSPSVVITQGVCPIDPETDFGSNYIPIPVLSSGYGACIQDAINQFNANPAHTRDYSESVEGIPIGGPPYDPNNPNAQGTMQEWSCLSEQAITEENPLGLICTCSPYPDSGNTLPPGAVHQYFSCPVLHTYEERWNYRFV